MSVMKSVLSLLVLCFVLSSLVTSLSLSPAPPVPPKQGAVSSGVYRNVFLEAGYAQAEIDSRLQSIWRQLLLGDPHTEAIVFPAQDSAVNGSYVEDINNGDVRTEGMSYGLMWGVQLDLQPLFDRLLRWYKLYMQHPAGDARAGYASWHCKPSGEVLDPNAASDGETWTVAALVLAARRWGDGGLINYTAEAAFVLQSALDKEQPPCGRYGCQGVVNMWGGAAANDSDPPMVRFVPEGGAATFTDASYQLPAFYEQWAISPAGSSRASYWASVAKTSRVFFHAVTHPVTGLAPNFASFDGQPQRGGSIFSFDAWRVARNVALDLAWYAVDYDWQVGFCNRLLRFFRGLRTWPQYGSEFTLDGNVTDVGHSPGLVAMNAVCALASNETVAWDFVQALWNMSTPTGGGRYYDGALYLEAWLHLSGNFRAVWSQDSVSAAVASS